MTFYFRPYGRDSPSYATVTFNENLTKIEDYTFYGCSGLFRITEFPLRLTEIGRSAFYRCESLSDVDFSDTRLQSIGKFAFYGCINLRTLKFPSTFNNLSDYAFYGASSLQEVVFPDSLKVIGGRAFAGSISLTSVTFGSQTETIGAYAFNNCWFLQSVTLPDSVVTVERGAFYECASLSSVDLGSVKEIGAYAFYSTGLVNLILPESVERVGAYAFALASHLQSVYVPETDAEIGTNAFYGCETAVIYTNKAQASEIWSVRWNSSYRPVVWGCALSEDGTYVSRVTGNVTFSNAINGIAAPVRRGYTFAGWGTTPAAAEYTDPADLTTVGENAVLYTVWQEITVPAEQEETDSN